MEPPALRGSWRGGAESAERENAAVPKTSMLLGANSAGQGIGWWQLVGHALQAVLEEYEAEVDQQAEPFVGEAKVGEELFPVHGKVLLDGLQFDDDRILDNKVGAEAFLEFDAIVTDRHRHLATNAQATAFETVTEEDFIDGLEEAGSEIGVQFVGLIHDDARDVVEVHGR